MSDDEARLDNIADEDFYCVQEDKPPDQFDQGDLSQVILNNDSETPLKQEIQRINWMFTWNNYPNNYIELLTNSFNFKNGVRRAKKYVFQQERGKNGTPHIQGCVSLYKKERWTSFNLPNTIHWEPVKNWKQCEAYCQKEETRDGETTTYGITITKKLVALKIIEELRPWQQTIVDMIKQTPDNRTINWVYDPNGGKGKTSLCKYLYEKYKCIPITSNNENDVFYILSKMKEGGRDMNDTLTLIFNFSRTKININYNLIESLKDGLGTSGKYESCVMCFNSPHIWIMSNNVPCVDNITKDKWKIWMINECDELIIKNVDTDFYSDMS